MKMNVDREEYKNAVSVEKMRQYDAFTIKNYVPSKELMYRAAMGVYNAVSWENKRIAIVCGSGNNGGDGYALACILAGKGIYPHIYRLYDRFSEDGLYYYEKAKGMGVEDRMMDSDADLSQYDIIADCILGTGFKGVPRKEVCDAVDTINNSSAYKISVDINSGLDGDSGRAFCAVVSDLTVSIGFLKKGMFLGDSMRYIGRLINVDIGIVKPEGE